MLQGSLMLVSSHYPPTVTTLDLSHQMLALPFLHLICLLKCYKISPMKPSRRSIFSPFTFRCTINLEIILTYGTRYECVNPPHTL